MKRVANDAGPARLGDDLAASTPSVPIPPPAALLKLAKKLGAISAGPAMFGRAPEEAVPLSTGDTPRTKAGKSAKVKVKRKK